MTAELTRVGNPSSLHTSGRAARRVVEESREAIATAFGAAPAEVIFTSGATEADNLIIKGAFGVGGRHRVVSAGSEHHAVLDSVRSLAAVGAEIDYLPTDADGLVGVADLRRLLHDRSDAVALVSVMWANNETGVLQPITQLAEVARAAGVTIHSDGVQAAGRVPIDFAASGLDALSITAHKLGGPVGVGALLARKELTLQPVQHGGGQERDVRSGTLDVAGVAGFAAAATVAVRELEAENLRLRTLRDRLIDGALRIDGSRLNGVRDPDRSLPSIANISFAGCQADNILLLLDQAGIDSSAGSACTAGVSQASHVLAAMGRDRAEALSAVRFSMGHTTTQAEVDRLLGVLPGAIEAARRAG